MNLNCEQALNNLPHLVTKADAPTTEPVSENVGRRTLLEHLRTCPDCQKEYEALWHTANVLENTDAPIPPPDLVRNIQQCVRHLSRHQQLAFFARPFAWVLDRLKVDLAPRLVNASVLLFFLVASGFVMKLTFFTNPPEPKFSLTASPWAQIKDTETEAQPSISSTAKQVPIVNRHSSDSFFDVTLNSAEMWSTRAADTVKETVDTTLAVYPQGTANEKLALFWSHIKTKL